jgi:hopanoid-associated phosphorylase
MVASLRSEETELPRRLLDSVFRDLDAISSRFETAARPAGVSERSNQPIIVAVCGLSREARLVGGERIFAVAGGGDAARLESRLEVTIRAGGRALISIGLAGALAPDLQPGDLVVADAVVAGAERIVTDPVWTTRLAAALPKRRWGDVLGSDAPITDPADKRALNRRTHALAVDMESHVTARVARRHGLPFAVLRAICDPADRAVPEVAARAITPDGGTDVLAVIRGILGEPALVPPLFRLARDSGAAFAALRRARLVLGPRLGLDF